MKGHTYIEISEDLHLEIDYAYSPEISSPDYDLPPDPAWQEIEGIALVGYVAMSAGHSVQVTIDITTHAEDLAAALAWDKLEAAVAKNISEQ